MHLQLATFGDEPTAPLILLPQTFPATLQGWQSARRLIETYSRQKRNTHCIVQVVVIEKDHCDTCDASPPDTVTA